MATYSCSCDCVISWEKTILIVFICFITETKDPDTLRAHQIKMSFFQTDVLNMMCRKLITHYFLLTAHDLRQWDSDPEGFGEALHTVNSTLSAELGGTETADNLHHG